MKKLILPSLVFLYSFMAGQPLKTSNEVLSKNAQIGQWSSLSNEEKLGECHLLSANLEDLIYSDSSLIEGFDELTHKGVRDATVIYGGLNDQIRGCVIEDSMIIIYSAALDYPDKCISTIFHEYNAHTTTQHIQVSTSQTDSSSFNKNIERTGTIIKEPNPYWQQPGDPFNTEYIDVFVVSTPLATIQEEINGYKLEKLLHDSKLITLKDSDIRNIEKFLFKYLKALENNR